MLMDGNKQGGPVRYSGIYLSKSCFIAIFSKVAYLGAYLCVLFLSSGDVFFFLSVSILYIFMHATNRWQ